MCYERSESRKVYNSATAEQQQQGIRIIKPNITSQNKDVLFTTVKQKCFPVKMQCRKSSKASNEMVVD